MEHFSECSPIRFDRVDRVCFLFFSLKLLCNIWSIMSKFVALLTAVHSSKNQIGKLVKW